MWCKPDFVKMVQKMLFILWLWWPGNRQTVRLRRAPGKWILMATAYSQTSVYLSKVYFCIHLLLHEIDVLKALLSMIEACCVVNIEPLESFSSQEPNWEWYLSGFLPSMTDTFFFLSLFHTILFAKWLFFWANCEGFVATLFTLLYILQWRRSFFFKNRDMHNGKLSIFVRYLDATVKKALTHTHTTFFSQNIKCWTNNSPIHFSPHRKLSNATITHNPFRGFPDTQKRGTHERAYYYIPTGENWTFHV